MTSKTGIAKDSGTELVSRGQRRAVAVHKAQDGAGRVVVLFHPAPGAGLFDPDPEATAAYGITLLEIDRPGYGASEPLAGGEWATVDSAADDAASILDQRGYRSGGVAGWSAGGRIALA